MLLIPEKNAACAATASDGSGTAGGPRLCPGRVELRVKPPANWARFASYTRERPSADGNIVPRADRAPELCQAGAASARRRGRTGRFFRSVIASASRVSTHRSFR
jgi:hypothetical protein